MQFPLRPRPSSLIDYVCLGIFTAEFLARLLTCNDVGRFALKPMNWVDLAAIAPFLLELAVMGPDSQSELGARGVEGRGGRTGIEDETGYLTLTLQTRAPFLIHAFQDSVYQYLLTRSDCQERVLVVYWRGERYEKPTAGKVTGHHFLLVVYWKEGKKNSLYFRNRVLAIRSCLAPGT